MKYLRGVKNVIKAARLQDLASHGDLAILLDWVYYHDVLARFTLRHWYRQLGKSANSLVTVACDSINITTHMSDWLAEVWNLHHTAR